MREVMPVADKSLTKEERKIFDRYFPANINGIRPLYKFGVLRLLKDLKQVEENTALLQDKVQTLEDMVDRLSALVK
jgi:hypothetical protein